MRQLACSRRANSDPEDSHTCDSSQFHLSRAFGHVQGTDSYSSDSFSISGPPAISHPAPVQASLQEAVRGTQCGGRVCLGAVKDEEEVVASDTRRAVVVEERKRGRAKERFSELDFSVRAGKLFWL
jgi:hypothetical protein